MRTISNNQQITFWLNGVESYNVKAEPQIMQVPYYLPANIDDELRVQVKDTVMSTYRLRAFDCNDNVLGTISLTPTLVGSEYVYDLLTTFGSLGVSTDMKVRLKIITSLFTASITGGLEEPDHTLDGDITNVNLTFSISGGLEEPDHSLYGEVVSTTIITAYRKSAVSAAGTCGAPEINYYSSNAPGTGVTIYTDIGLIYALTGFSFISWADGEVYEINPATGVIGAGTGFFC